MQEFFNQLFSLTNRDQKKGGLERMEKMLEHLGQPQLQFQSIHIAGSNGKGSVAFKTAAALQESGLKVGLYTSPHLFHFCERIVIQGRQIEKTLAVRELKKLIDLANIHEISLTFFELATLLAVKQFAEEKVDIAVIEAGLGGRKDATNVLVPICSVITSISLEHTAILGDSLDKIAEEKAGILKPGVPLVLGPNAQRIPILTKAKQMGCAISLAETADFFDEENRQVAAQVLGVVQKQLSLQFDSKTIEQALCKRPACRFEEHGDLIFDVAHNPDAFAKLKRALQSFYPNHRFRFVLGFSEDKDALSCLKQILPLASHIYLVQSESPRALAAQKLQDILVHLQFFSSSVHLIPSQAVSLGKRELQVGEKLVICGSFYIMQEAFSAQIL